MNCTELYCRFSLVMALFGSNLQPCNAGQDWIENCQAESGKTNSLAKERYVNICDDFVALWMTG